MLRLQGVYDLVMLGLQLSYNHVTTWILTNLIIYRSCAFIFFFSNLMVNVVCLLLFYSI